MKHFTLRLYKHDFISIAIIGKVNLFNPPCDFSFNRIAAPTTIRSYVSNPPPIVIFMLCSEAVSAASISQYNSIDD